MARKLVNYRKVRTPTESDAPEEVVEEAEEAEEQRPKEELIFGLSKPTTLQDCISAIQLQKQRLEWLEKLLPRLQLQDDPDAFAKRLEEKIRDQVRAEYEDEIERLKGANKRTAIARAPRSTAKQQSLPLTGGNGMSQDSIIAVVKKMQPASRKDLADALGVPNNSTFSLRLKTLREQKVLKMSGDRAAARWSVR